MKPVAQAAPNRTRAVARRHNHQSFAAHRQNQHAGIVSRTAPLASKRCGPKTASRVVPLACSAGAGPRSECGHCLPLNDTDGVDAYQAGVEPREDRPHMPLPPCQQPEHATPSHQTAASPTAPPDRDLAEHPISGACSRFLRPSGFPPRLTNTSDALRVTSFLLLSQPSPRSPRNHRHPARQRRHSHARVKVSLGGKKQPPGHRHPSCRPVPHLRQPAPPSIHHTAPRRGP